MKKRNPSKLMLGPAFRILDANLNRAKEGLRVVEDISRFALEDRDQTRAIKSCRHQLTQAVLKLPVNYRVLLEHRDISNDSGKNGQIGDKQKNLNIMDILSSNWRRSQEAVRVLEEITKVIDKHSSKRFQNIRFKIYELEKRSLSKF